MLFATLIEWDGKAPPSRYYHRIRRLGLRVRGDKEQDVLERRSTTNADVIAQEGLVLTASSSLAYAVAAEAKYCGARLVIVSEIDKRDEYNVSEKDKKVLDYIDSVFGKRGRPTAERADWIVTCHEEGKSFEVKNERDVCNCPHCYGLVVDKRQGDSKLAFRDFDQSKDDLFDYWKVTRFSVGFWEEPLIASYGLEPDVSTLEPLFEQDEQDVMALVLASAEVKAICQGLLREVSHVSALRFLDALYNARAHINPEIRLKARVNAITQAMMSGYMPEVMLAEHPTEVDVFDSAAVLGTEETFTLYKLAQKWAGNNGHRP